MFVDDFTDFYSTTDFHVVFNNFCRYLSDELNSALMLVINDLTV